MPQDHVDADAVLAAAERLEGKIHRTQLLESIALNNMCGGRILVKADNLQMSGSFKIRGAMNRVLTLSKEVSSFSPAVTPDSKRLSATGSGEKRKQPPG